MNFYRAVRFAFVCSALAWTSPVPLVCSYTNARATEADLRVFPEQMQLHGRGSNAAFTVQRVLDNDDDGLVGQQVTEFQCEIQDEDVARFTDGRVVAVGAGATELLIHAAGSKLRLPIVVSASEDEQHWQFEAHVQSVLARAGCNSGACHGALAGKGGFRLSLRGYDSKQDHYTLTKQDRGRRIEPADPGRSLILAKPTGLIAHKGGLRLSPESRDYKILADWIAQGAVGPKPEDAALERVEVLPRRVRLDRADKQQLLVRAHYADGRIEDVTSWAKFSSANEVVAQVDDQGQLEVVGHGKGAIVVWFASRIAIASIVAPYPEPETKEASDFISANFIDDILAEEWQSLNLSPSPECSDLEFLRRAYLDTTGTLPSESQVRAFMADDSEQKRAQLVDQLLSGESYVDYWAYKWSDLLLVNGNLLRPDAVAAFYTWIRQSVEDNLPWDEFVREIVLARGGSLEQGATNFYAIHQTPEDLTENTCQAFLGLSIGCAKCHNHPLEKWTNDQYYAMANLYSRVRAKGWGGDSRNGDGVRTLVVLERGDLIQPSTGQPQAPAPLDSVPIDIHSPEDRRVALAQWLTDSDNPYFSRSIANRIWANYMGTGLVESVDDLRASNPASSEKLLNKLANFLVENNYDLKSLSRLILNSSVYQRSTIATPGNAGDSRFFCRYYAKRLNAEVLHDAIVGVTNVPSTFDKIEFSGADTRATDFYPSGTKSIELYDSAVVNYFLKTFGRHQRRITCTCERSDQPTVVQVLHLSNGDTLNEKLSSDKCIVANWVADDVPVDEVIDQAYFRALSRPPSADEAERIGELISQGDEAGVSRRESYEDLLWSLMTSREFLFRH